MDSRVHIEFLQTEDDRINVVELGVKRVVECLYLSHMHVSMGDMPLSPSILESKIVYIQLKVREKIIALAHI